MAFNSAMQKREMTILGNCRREDNIGLFKNFASFGERVYFYKDEKGGKLDYINFAGLSKFQHHCDEWDNRQL